MSEPHPSQATPLCRLLVWNLIFSLVIVTCFGTLIMLTNNIYPYLKTLFCLVCGVNTSKRPCACGYFECGGGWGGGVGWDVNVHCHCNHTVRSLALPHIRHATLVHVLLHFHTNVMLRCCTFSCTSTHTSCYAGARSLAFPHIRHAMLLHVLLHFHTYVMLCCCTFSCTSTQMSCYAAARSLALPHKRHATLLHVLLQFHTYVMLCCCTFSCTSTHTSCYAGARSLAFPHIRHAMLLHALLHFHTYVMLCCCTFSCTSTQMSCYAAARSLALPHKRHATLLHVLLQFHTYVLLRCCTFSCTSTQMSCYAAARSLALPHIRHATLLHVLLHFHKRHSRSQNSLPSWWLQSLERSLQTTSARKTPQMAKLCPPTRRVCEALGRKPTKNSSSLARTQTLDRQWDWLKTRFPGSWIHIQTADKISEKMEVLVCCSLAQDRQRQCPEQPRAWKEKKTFRRNPRRTKLLFRACKTLDFPLFEVTRPRDVRQKFIPDI